MAITRNEIIEDLQYIILGIMAAVAIYVFFGVILGAKNPIVSVVSSSMEPTLHVGDMLVLKGVEIEDLEVGEIVVYYHPSKGDLIVHRVYELYDDGTFKTKGDNPKTNRVPDPWIVQPEWVRGVVFIRLQYLGYPRLMLMRFLGAAS